MAKNPKSFPLYNKRVFIKLDRPGRLANALKVLGAVRLHKSVNDFGYLIFPHIQDVCEFFDKSVEVVIHNPESRQSFSSENIQLSLSQCSRGRAMLEAANRIHNAKQTDFISQALNLGMQVYTLSRKFLSTLQFLK